MLQNKIYQNFIKEILKTFFVILLGLTLIAWTVRAVNFLDLIVENGYSVSTYFQYSLLNLFGILTKFIPLAFLLSLMIFIVKQIQEKEFLILWTSGVKKIKIANRFIVNILTVNGVRFTLENGSWGLVRASSNKPALVVVTESVESKEEMKSIFNFIDNLLASTKKIGEYDQTI